MLVWISLRSAARCSGGASSSIATAIFSRASGLRSSWLALASRLWCDRSSTSMRAAARLKLAPRAATSSRPSSATRWCRAPAPKASTPCLRDSSRRVRPRTTGQAPAATARKIISSSTTRPTPSGQARGPPIQGGRISGDARAEPAPRAALGRGTHSVRPSSKRMERNRAAMSGASNSRRTKESDAAMRLPAASSSAIGRRRRCDQSRKAANCSAGAASAAGSERCSSSPQASTRSRAAPSARWRCSSMCCCTRAPETTANRASAATTVR